MNTFKTTGLSLVILLLLGACGALPEFGGDKIPDNIYDLSVSAPNAQLSGDADKTLLVERLSFPAFIDTEKIAVKPSSNEIVYLSDARWSDKGPDMVARYLLLSLESTEGWLVIDRQHTALVHDYRLEVDIRDFSVHLEGAANPTIVIEISADLMAVTPLQVISRKGFSSEIVASANTKDAIVKAFNRALGDITGEVSVWLQQTVE